MDKKIIKGLFQTVNRWETTNTKNQEYKEELDEFNSQTTKNNEKLVKFDTLSVCGKLHGRH